MSYESAERKKSSLEDQIFETLDNEQEWMATNRGVVGPAYWRREEIRKTLRILARHLACWVKRKYSEPPPEVASYACGDCGKDLPRMEHDVLGGLCSPCYGKRARAVAEMTK